MIGLALIAAFAIGAGLFFFCRPPGDSYGHLRLNVVDAYTLAPVANADVVLPESGLIGKSDGSGFCLIYNVPVARPALLRDTPGLIFGETSIFVYAKGYLPCALLHARVYPNRVRSGPTVYIFPEGMETGISATTIVESPDEAEMRALLAQYAP